MLVLSRRLNEKIVFPGIQTTVQVVAIKAGAVRLGIEAPPNVTVFREELQERMAEWQGAAPAPAAVDAANLGQMLSGRLRVAGTGLALLRRQLQAGRTQDAAITLDKLEEDLAMLRERLEKEEQRPKPRKGQPRKALLVEDNANERELMALFLRSAGLDVATAGDGSDALDYLHQRGRPDVVLLDMGLPRVDGASTVRAIRSDPAYTGLKIFAVTGHSPDEFDLGPRGVDRWFHKPIDPMELLRNVNAELDVVTSGA